MRRKMPVTLAALVGAALLSAGAPATAHTTEAAPRAAANALNCQTWVNGYQGFADCTNNTNRAIAFRVSIVCGWWPDTYGQWVTLNSGQRGTSAGECGGGSGAGSASWVEG
ncbi:hypothetical protein [Streptomyces sp. NPDC058326]|uniref:hypothetical protein n=1 Tax=Streptomyces sp. NPDC058326 TaxID=3346447 RepID=UPI0036EF439C